MTKLSVIVITKNEVANIEACLRSVSFAEQLVVLDSGSSDGTVAAAQKMGAEVSLSPDWRGFGVQKNRVLDLAKEEWVLSIDADERLSPQLQAEIISTLQNPEFEVYNLPRRSSYCGQYMNHSGWYPDRVTRLFRRGSARFSNDIIHEKLVTLLPVGELRADILHESFRNLESVLHKVNRYSTDGALLLFERNRKTSLGKALSHGFWAFFRTYILRFGFLDGKMGLVLAISNAEGTYYRYLKLWLMSRDNRASK